MLAKLDFLIQKEGQVIPVEIKSGDHVKAKSLRLFQNRYQPKTVYRVSEKNFGRTDEVCSIPLYAMFCI